MRMDIDSEKSKANDMMQIMEENTEIMQKIYLLIWEITSIPGHKE